MKKAMVSIALLLSILLTLTSCDALIGELGASVVDLLPGEVGGLLQEIAPEIFGEKDDPEANIAYIVNTVNEGRTLRSFVEEQEEVDTKEMAEELKAQIAALTGEVNFKANSDGERVSGYAAVKDKVIYVDAEDEQAYVFIEDDFKLVAVSGSKADGYYGDVEDSLVEFFEMLDGDALEDELENEFDDDQLEFAEELMDITLPKASLEDIIYEDGRYYLSEDYMERTVRELAEEILNTYFDIYPDEVDDDIYDSLQEGIEDTLDVLDIKIWYYVYCEEFTGMGISVDAVGDLSDIDESLEDVQQLHVVIDMNAGFSTIDIECRGEEDYEVVDVYVTVAQAYNEEDELEQCKITCSATVPFEEYEYISGEYYYDSEYVYIYGLTNINFSLDMDLSNLEGNGNVLSVTYDSNVSDIEAYTSSYYGSNESYSGDYTSRYSRYKNEATFSLSVIAENDGQNIDVDLSFKSKDQFNDDSSKFTLEAEISKTADNMPSVPSKVERARQDALDEYEEYGNSKETYPEDETYFEDDYDYGW